MKNSLLERFRSWAIDRVAGLLNLNSDWITGPGCDSDTRWLMELGWWLDAQLTALFIFVYEGSDQELEDALDGRPLDHMTERQRAWFIAAEAQGGAS